MKLPEFGLLTDENINPIVAAELRAMGFDVFDVCENGLFGSEDTVLLSRARADGRVVVTHDSDFGTLAVARMEPLVGILYLRPGHIDPKFTLESFRSVVERNQDLAPPFIVVAKRTGNIVRIRVRNL